MLELAELEKREERDGVVELEELEGAVEFVDWESGRDSR